MVERINVAGMGEDLAASEVKYHMLESAAQAVRKMGREGLKRWAGKTAGKILARTGKTAFEESFVEEPTQQLMTEFGLALDRRQEELRKEVADAAGVDVKTAEVLTQYLRTESDMELVSPKFSAWASLHMSLADINEESIKTVLPGYVEGSFASDPEKGVYSGKVKLGKAKELRSLANILTVAIDKGKALAVKDEWAKTVEDFGLTDPSNKSQLIAVRDKINERSNYWENAVRLDEADKAAMDAEINAAADAKAKKLQELKAKREAAKSGKPKVVVSKNATTTPADETKPPAGETKRPSGETKKADSETKKPVSETQKPALGTENAVSETKTGKTEMSKVASKTPSIKMKDEAAEKLAQKQEDDLAALFDTPEFGIILTCW